MKKLSLIAVASLMFVSAQAFAVGSLDTIVQSNNKAGVSYASQHQEHDNYATDGTGFLMNSADSTLHGGEVTASVQHDVGPVGYVYGAVSVQRLSGSGTVNVYSPFDGSASAEPGNDSVHSASVRVGKGLEMGGFVMVTPYLQYARVNADSSFTGIGMFGPVTVAESYTDNQLGTGVMAQVAVTDKLVVTGDLVSMTSSAHRTVTFNGLVQKGPDLNTDSNPSFKLAADYAVTRHLHITAAYQDARRSLSYTFLTGYDKQGNPIYQRNDAERLSNHSFLLGAAYAF